jgi:anti-sigma regulatory factor (Ser/Thr protein kinase)
LTPGFTFHGSPYTNDLAATTALRRLTTSPVVISRSPPCKSIHGRLLPQPLYAHSNTFPRLVRARNGTSHGIGGEQRGGMTVGILPGTVKLAGTPLSVRAARHFVRETPGERHPALDDVTLLVSELATNAISHSVFLKEGGIVTFIIGELSRNRLHVIVTDDGSACSRPQPRAAETTDESGRGLALLEGLTNRWSTYPMAHGEPCGSNSHSDPVPGRVRAAPGPNTPVTARGPDNTRSVRCGQVGEPVWLPRCGGMIAPSGALFGPGQSRTIAAHGAYLLSLVLSWQLGLQFSLLPIS